MTAGMHIKRAAPFALALAIWGLCGEAVNNWGLWAYLLLWAMHLSARLAAKDPAAPARPARGGFDSSGTLEHPALPRPCGCPPALLSGPFDRCRASEDPACPR